MKKESKEKLCSAGLVYFYICGEEENDEIFIEHVNSYELLPNEFYKRVCELTEYMESFNSEIEIFGVLGLKDKVNDVKEIIIQGIRKNYEDIIEGKRIKKSNKWLDLMGNTFYRLIQEYFCCINIHKPTYDILQNEECLAVIFYDEQVEEPQVIIDALNLWLEKEEPIILGKQTKIQSFLLKEIIGRMIIGILPDRKDNGWNIVLEGGLKLSLEGQPHFTGERVGYYDVDLMTAGQIDEVVGNPVYAYGKFFSPIGVFRGWNKAFLYACAVSDEKWTAKKIENAYNRLLRFLEEHICTVEYAPPIIDMKLYIGALLANIEQIRLYLQGKDEQVVSKDILKLMNTKYVYLPYIYENVGIKRKLNNSLENFSKNHLKKLLDASETFAKYDKGIAWERVAEYILQYVEGLTITGKRIRTKYQEIDISVANTSLSNDLWKMGAYILVECKNWRKLILA